LRASMHARIAQATPAALATLTLVGLAARGELDGEGVAEEVRVRLREPRALAPRGEV